LKLIDVNNLLSVWLASISSIIFS